ncbi:conserved hypothetical protein, partial [Trichinella spiralis]|uniref:hypothetical protein n=1 Tax=Trichinella spiralis TaxID=6334 RepID=UPI0001EFDCEB
WCMKGSIDLFVVFQFRQSGGHSFEHVVANGLVLLVWQKIDAFPRLEASLNNELSKPPPPPPQPRIRWRASVETTSLGHFFCQLSMVPLKRNLIGRICDLLRHVSIPRTNFFLR